MAAPLPLPLPPVAVVEAPAAAAAAGVVAPATVVAEPVVDTEPTALPAVVARAAPHAPSKTITGRNTFDPTQTIELKMHQFDFEFGYAWR